MKRKGQTSAANSDGERPQKPPDVRDVAGHGAKTAAVRERAILALLTEKSIGKAAAKCGVHEKTLRRWMADDEEFKRALAEARHLTFEAAMNRVQALMGQAIDTLTKLMSPRLPPAVRLGAARTVAELGIHRDDADTIMRKLDEIEAHQRQQDTAGKR